MIQKLPHAFLAALWMFCLGMGPVLGPDPLEKHCRFRTSQTPLTKDELLGIAETQSFRLCVDSRKFDKYELKDLLRSRIDLVVSIQETNFDKYDLKDMRGTGAVSLVLDSDRFDKYDLRDLASGGFRDLVLRRKSSELRFDKYDLKDLAQSGIKTVLALDDRRFDKSDLKDLAQNRAVSKVVLWSSSHLFDRFDLEDMATAATGRVPLVLVLDDSTFNSFDLRQLGKAGIELRGSSED